MAFATNVFPAPDYIPESFSSDPFNVRSGEGVVELRLLDPPQREQPAFKPSAIEHKRAKTYQDSNVILVMFSIADRSSFDSARSRWADEVKRLAPQVPLLLIGLKTDLRLVGEEFVSKSEATSLAFQMGAVAYRECSAKTREGVNDLFDFAIGIATGTISSEKMQLAKVEDQLDPTRSICLVQ